MQLTDLKGVRLSLQQERLWPFQQTSGAYKAQCAVLLSGRLEYAAFQQALQEMVAEHEILRTVFYLPPGMDIPLQVIADRSEIACQQIDLTHLDHDAQNALFETTRSEFQATAYDLSQGPLLNLCLWRLSAERHLFLLCLPALCADTATLPLLISELSNRYAKGRSTQEPDEEPLQYSDISTWQNELLEDEEAQTAYDFWQRSHLSQIADLRLPFLSTTSVRSEPADFQPNVQPIPLEASFSASLLAMAQQLQISPETMFLACWQILLWRLTGQTDQTIGVADNARSHEELTTIPGPLTRFLPTSIQIAPHHSFEQVLQATDATLQETRHWQPWFTWHLLRQSIAEQEVPSFFPITFEYEQWPTPITHGALTFSLKHSSATIEPFYLHLHILHQETELQLELRYNTAQYTAVRIEQLSSAFDTLLQQLVARPQAALHSLPIMSPERQEQLLQAWQGPRLPRTGQTFQQLFEEQAQQRPSQLAALSPNQRLTYQELNSRANQLARILRTYGVGPDVLVGLCLPRSAEMLIGLLAILKAGGAYVPLDADMPATRLAYQLQNSQAKLLLTQHDLLPHLPEWPGQILTVEALQELTAKEESSNLPAISTAENLAYIIYTSGSTGLPKGVMIRQENLVSYTQALCTRLQVRPGWHFATVSTLAADLGNTSIFCALASGGCLHVLDYATITSSEAFARWTTQYPLDVLKIVPSHLTALLDGEQTKTILPRRALLLGGEALPISLVERVQDLNRTCAIYNHYGPTEATIGVLVHPISPTGLAANGSSKIPLGRPFANTDLYILDPWQHVVPPGIVGELYIGGDTLATGYLQQPEQTAERFIPHPFRQQAGLRLYKTGDLVSFNAQGEFEFVGRRDTQIKLRGFRIELGEIEAVLRQHPAIRNSAVLLHESATGESQLVACLVARTKPTPTPQQFRSFLRERVPEYMLPAEFLFLKVLPFTANGKLERQQLAQIVAQTLQQRAEAASSQRSSPFLQPRDAVEFRLLRIWEEVLQTHGISIRDNFFEIGGHSILAVRLMSHILTHFQQDLPVAVLFQHPTIADLALVLRQQLPSEDHATLVPLQSQGAKRPFFCIHPSGGTVFSYVQLARHLGQDQPFYGLQTAHTSHLDSERSDSIETIAAHYITAIQTIQPEGPYLLGGWSMGGVIALEMAQQLHKQGQEVALLAALDSMLSNADMRAQAQTEKHESDEIELIRETIAQYQIVPPDDFATWDTTTQLHYVLEQVKQLHILPADVSLAQILRITRLTKLHSKMARLYVPQPYAGHIHYFTASPSTTDTEHQQARQAQINSWQQIAGKGIEVHVIPGNHREMIEEPHVQLLATQLKDCIEQAQNPIPPDVSSLSFFQKDSSSIVRGVS